MLTNRIFLAFLLYAALGLFAGAALEGVGISVQKGDVTLQKLLGGRKRERREQYYVVYENTKVAAQQVNFWVLPVLMAAGLGIFFAYSEHTDGTALQIDDRPDSSWEYSYDDD